MIELISTMRVNANSFKNVEVVNGFFKIELYGNHLRFVSRAKINTTDDNTGGVKEEDYNSDESYLKKFITGVSVYWSDVDEVWKLEVNIIGVADDIIITFDEKLKAKEMQSSILEWLLKDI